jgi:hypothetical protein
LLQGAYWGFEEYSKEVMMALQMLLEASCTNNCSRGPADPSVSSTVFNAIVMSA